ncbi:MAG TPA: hypothetical protein VK510_08720, partial [Solirubrobacteraceae bacterium]|nr:hypothetical protein [Solirubrobacteraceae bacterium]
MNRVPTRTPWAPVARAAATPRALAIHHWHDEVHAERARPVAERVQHGCDRGRRQPERGIHAVTPSGGDG